MNRAFLDEYDRQLAPLLPSLRDLLEGRLRQWIDEAGLMVHSLGGRVKSRSSLERKLSRPDRSYRSLLEVTDLLAFRVITYSEDLIDEVARIIESRLDVDFGNSVNKLHHEDSQKFGYRSLHYICALPAEALERVAGVRGTVKFEIQIRTILQHTWAEIEHDIGYKANEQLPREFRRRFSQIASLLEVADREFASIRTDLKAYEARLRQSDPLASRAELDHLSLQAILGREEIAALDREVAGLIGAPLGEEAFFPDYILRVLRAAGLRRVDDLLRSASAQREALGAFLAAYFEFARGQWGLEPGSIPVVNRGYGLLFLAHLQVLHAEALLINQVDRLARFYAEIDYPDDPASARSAAQALVAVLKAKRMIRE